MFCHGLASEALSIALPWHIKLCWSYEIPVFVLHYIVELPTDWPVKSSSPLSAVAYTSAASHYRSVIIQLTVISWLSSLDSLNNMDWWIFIFYRVLNIWHLKSSLIRFCWIFVTSKRNWNGSLSHWFVWSIYVNRNKKLRCCKQHSASIVHSWCAVSHFSRENLLMANQPNLRNGPRKLPNLVK